MTGRFDMLNHANLFVPIYVGSDIWQNVGWNCIIYLSALTSIDTELYEAARIDGANRWQQTLHVTLPGILGTVVLLLILRVGSLMNVGYEKVILLYNEGIYETADVIQSYVYRRGLVARGLQLFHGHRPVQFARKRHFGRIGQRGFQARGGYGAILGGRI